MPGTLLLDTDVLLYHLGEGLEAAKFRPIIDGKALAVSFATAGEVTMHARRSSHPNAEKAVARILLDQIVHIGCDPEVSRRWGELAASGASRTPEGRVRHSNDLWTAAVALRHNLPLVTNNRKDFEGLSGLRLLL